MFFGGGAFVILLVCGLVEQDLVRIKSTLERVKL